MSYKIELLLHVTKQIFLFADKLGQIFSMQTAKHFITLCSREILVVECVKLARANVRRRTLFTGMPVKFVRRGARR